MQLAVHNVTKNFGGLVALDGCSFACAGGSITGLVGPNGSGKSTVFNIITGVIAPSTGHVELDGQRLTGQRPHQVARRGVGRSFQTTRLFKSLSVLDNVLLGASSAGASPSTRDAMAWLDRFGLATKAETTADALSFGQQRLVELARALIAKPVVMLLDEPFAGLSPAMAAELKSHIVELPARGIGVILIEHNLAMVMELCPRVLVLHQGRIIADGSPDAIRRDPLVADAYLGSTHAAAA